MCKYQRQVASSREQGLFKNVYKGTYLFFDMKEKMRKNKNFRRIIPVLIVLFIGSVGIGPVSASKITTSNEPDDWEHISALKRQQSDPLYLDVNHSFSIEFTHTVYLKRLIGGTGAWQTESDVPSQTQNYSLFQMTSSGHMATILPYPVADWKINTTSNLLVLTISVQMKRNENVKEMQFSSIFNLTSSEFSTVQVERDIVNTISGSTMIMVGSVSLGVLWIFWRRKKRLLKNRGIDRR